MNNTVVKYELEPRAYIPASTVKTNIVLHGSFTRTKYTYTGQDASEQNLMHKWDMLSDKCGGHYVVTRAGNIYSCVDEDFWSNHLGMDKRFSKFNKQSISIFISNELYLTEENSKYYAFGVVKPYNMYTGPMFKADAKGYKVWADYEKVQINSLVNLIEDICNRQNIPKTLYKHTTQHNINAWDAAGILSCANTNPNSYSLPFPKWIFDKFEGSGITLVS